jgi:hypothetical protein
MSVRTGYVVAVFLALLVFSTPVVSQPPFLNAGIVGSWVAEATITTSPLPAGFPPWIRSAGVCQSGRHCDSHHESARRRHARAGNLDADGAEPFYLDLLFYQSNTIPALSAYPLLLKTRVVENIQITGNGNTYETGANPAVEPP